MSEKESENTFAWMLKITLKHFLYFWFNAFYKCVLHVSVLGTWGLEMNKTQSLYRSHSRSTFEVFPFPPHLLWTLPLMQKRAWGSPGNPFVMSLAYIIKCNIHVIVYSKLKHLKMNFKTLSRHSSFLWRSRNNYR